MKCKDGNVREILEVRKDPRDVMGESYIIVYNLTETKRVSQTLEANDELDAYNQFMAMHRVQDEEET